MIPDGGPSRQRGCGKAGTIVIGRYEAVCSRKVAFAFGASNLAGGSISAYLLVSPYVGLAVVRAGSPIGENSGAEGLEVQFAFPCAAKGAFPVSFI